MKKNHAIQYFGSASAVARALGIHRSSVARWSEIVPIARALELAKLSDGALKVRLEDYAGYGT